MSKLVGNNSNQVPTNADLGSAAYAEKSSFITSKNPKISEIRHRIEQGNDKTVVDIFVYDTAQDSDGGAWRHRCQQTGWYKEKLNTVDRGDRREFPSIAVIILFSNDVTILDGDSPNLDMWMEFKNKNSWNEALLVGSLNSCCHAKNGTLAIGQSGNAQGVVAIDFIADDSTCITSGANYGGHDALSIADRNRSGHTFMNGPQNHAYPIWSSNDFADVEVAVSSRSKMNPFNGMPYNIIVGANGQGMQKYDSQTRSIITFSDNLGGARPFKNVSTIDDDIIGYNHNNGTVQRMRGGLLLTSNSANIIKYNYTVNGGHSSNSSISAVLRRSSDRNRVTPGKTVSEFYTDGQEGLTYMYDGPSKTFSTSTNSIYDGRVAYIAYNYATGWHTGTAITSILNDTNQGAVPSTNIWTDGSPSGTHASAITKHSYQSASADGTGGNSSQYFIGVLSPSPTIAYKSVAVTFTISNYVAGSVRPRIYSSAGIGDYESANGTYTQVIYNSGSSNGSLQMQFGGGSNMTIVINNVSIAVDNKTPKGKSGSATGFRVHGTPRRERVMPGADLTCMTTFSQSNYLKQPHTSHLDFGTDDFVFMTWLKTRDKDGFNCLMHRGDGSSGTWGSGKILQCEFNATELAFFASDSAFNAYDKVSIPKNKFTNNQWHHYAAIRKDGVLKAYLDGDLVASVASTRNLDNSNASLWIGERPNASRPAYDMSLSLLRISGNNSPGDEEVKEIYLSEKMMFRKNAQSTLYSITNTANNADEREVTAVAYDKSTDLMHAATATAISTFQGLVRVREEITDINYAVSAGGGLVIGD